MAEKNKMIDGKENAKEETSDLNTKGPELVQMIGDRLTFLIDQNHPEKSVIINGISGSQKSLAAASLLAKYNTAVIVVPTQKDIFRWEENLKFFVPDARIFSFPVVEEAGFEGTFSSTERLRERMRSLSAMVNGEKSIIIAAAVEAAQKISAPSSIKDHLYKFELGSEIERREVLEVLQDLGYERVDQVERSGHFSVRGDIVDIYPINEIHPVRIEFFGDEIDSIRLFDVDSQRSIETLESQSVFPVAVKGSKNSSVLSYLDHGIVFYDEPQRGEESLKQFFKEEKANAGKAFLWSELIHTARKQTNQEIVFSLLKRELEEFKPSVYHNWNGQEMTNYQRQIPIFTADLKSLLNKNRKTAIVIPRASEKREIEGILTDHQIPMSLDIEEGKVVLLDGVLTEGFELSDFNLALITAGDILGRQKLRKYSTSGSRKQIRYFSDLNPGDYVVQQVHGIGRYLGIRTIELSGVHRDYITIQYAGSDKLYLPVDQIGTLEKYIGPEGETPRLHTMGGANWKKIRSKAKKSIQELAEKLLDVYAKRELAKGIAFAPDTAEQVEFEDSFPYVETEDQENAISVIKKAMEKPTPMDMLLCGDVGFGKTEVAMRAVFKCVMSGYQAMVLCPTTVLSEQHYKNFKSRMDSFGVNIAVLNRFTKASERTKILHQLESGELDVVIGTHSVLNKKIKCRRLGLLVVDEEQRFGVVQKERRKSLAEGIDVLTLSATPIPRTLHMSLTGLRDMVTITTPPPGRHAIQTYVSEYDDSIVIDAILREKERGGQSFFVYNRIETMPAMLDHLKSILPDTISIGVAYGRMDGAVLEKVMLDFYQGKHDVLLCTTLIENGLDQPNANTMLVYDADKLGLSQIYQMRGRVGRSDKIARAWFFYNKDKVLSEVAEKRLNTIREFTELGSGFKVAMRDLEIRGAGNLLGSAQHGNIASVGFAAYCSMLEEAVQRLMAEREHKPLPKKLPNTTIEFRQDAYLDSKYISNEEQKMEIYRRLASVEDEKVLADLIDEAVDRYGTPTEPAEKLFSISLVRIKARKLGIGSVIDEGDSMLLTWADEDFMRGWNPNLLLKALVPYLHFLPGNPARLRIRKAGIKGSPMKWLGGFLDELMSEIHHSSH